ncbi:type II toxin-antitoxin system HicA family toxin [Acidihalobacter aeolianus]|uniref:type II toxin-antitoxin system HicA family toxin n=1 Tax=Acidihalobacter aeolianus TaxID=2792603 RepID=UPI0012E9C175|nr:type II toxin-antitoxin system HicA family toxin [Acidihalobacter aeolianus]
MSKHKKTLEKLKSPQTPSDLKWSELSGLLRHLGYEVLKNSGSRRKFINRETNALIICHEPHQPECVDKGCVADVVEHLKANNIIKSGD